jgi:hypothetical protein
VAIDACEATIPWAATDIPPPLRSSGPHDETPGRQLAASDLHLDKDPMSPLNKISEPTPGGHP